MLVAVFAVLSVVLLAVVLLAVVAESSGRLTVKHPTWQRLVSAAARHLEGRGVVPKFLERLDQRTP